MPLLELGGVTKSFGGLRVINELDLTVAEGEIVSVIGPNGAGYTTLVIEHDMHVVEGISDRVVALDHGVKIAEGSFEAVATDERVVEAYLGVRGAEEEAEAEAGPGLFPPSSLTGSPPP